MLARRFGVVVATVAIAGAGCSGSQVMAGDDQVAGDATAAVLYEPFSSMTWSLEVVDGHTQISISDQAGAAACALGADEHNHLTGTGRQIILQLPEVTTDTACPVGSYTEMRCSGDLGNAALVPMGCAYYRKFDDAGNVLGTAPAIDATVQIGGSASECALRVNVGFYGASFTEQESLLQSPGTQPWCGGS